MNTILKYSGVVALVILAILIVMNSGGNKNIFGSTACSGITCLSGGLRLVTDAGGDFESDVAAIFGGTVAASSTLQATGATTLYSTLGVSATTTLSDTVNFNNPGICINLYATSTVTRLHMVASTTAPANGAAGVMTLEYGACAL